ncbi:hypothetical protein [Spongorhabdus nitratireducens]
MYHLPADVLQERRYRHFTCFQQFMTSIDEKGILMWSPLASPERWGDNRLRITPPAESEQSENQWVAGDNNQENLITGRLAEVCLRGFYGEKCEYFRCNLVHLTPLEEQQVHNNDCFFRGDGGHNAKICPDYVQRECNDPECIRLHIDFEYPRLLWFPKD